MTRSIKEKLRFFFIAGLVCGWDGEEETSETFHIIAGARNFNLSTATFVTVAALFSAMGCDRRLLVLGVMGWDARFWHTSLLV